ncbi:MAG: helix-turn-helix transcriptional regulator [Mesorhizobium sp.]|uniref:helix-turn-helix domain-containing protein n=1 Tax=Mesorhizobium sp. TaxID=1871066 RepID=UPI0012075092|nr:MAG: helix-turn-helix transcriptional regulator [Mesorhizobium sp.]
MRPAAVVVSIASVNERNPAPAPAILFIRWRTSFSERDRRSKLAPMLGLSDQVYNRYENAVSWLTVGRLLHICEVLSISPVEILYPVAPHLWGRN